MNEVSNSGLSEPVYETLCESVDRLRANTELRQIAVGLPVWVNGESICCVFHEPPGPNPTDHNKTDDSSEG